MKQITFLLLTLISSNVFSIQFKTNEEIDRIFKDYNVPGTLVIRDINKNNYIIHNLKRAQKRFVPASTFKILNTLIGLEVGAVKSTNEILPFGGKPQPIKSWEKDMSLQEAIKVSNVPIYQELARRIGINKMTENIKRTNYGNNIIGSIVDDFWLKGPLKISALEQTDFLTRLVKKELPFSKNNQKTIHDMVLFEKDKNYTIYAKTGWAMNIGWWVGWIYTNSGLYCFALNIDMKDIKNAPKRIEIGKKAMHALGLT